MSLPPFDRRGNLPAGIHTAVWPEFVHRFSSTSRRVLLMKGLHEALVSLERTGCRTVYIDGSFVTAKAEPVDFDACWSVEGVSEEQLDPIFLTFDHGRAAQKARFGGELFPAELPEGLTGRTFLSFFQIDKEIGGAKGIVSISLVKAELEMHRPEEHYENKDILNEAQE